MVTGKKLEEQAYSRMQMTEGRINELEQWSNDFAQSSQQKKTDWKHKTQQRTEAQRPVNTSKISNDCIITEGEYG